MYISTNDDIITLKPPIIYNFANSEATNTPDMHVNYKVSGPLHMTSR